jgi:diketogulonate reductase-like aldo/keto reductase
MHAVHLIEPRSVPALIDTLAGRQIANVSFFPPGGFNSLQSARLTSEAEQLGMSPMQLALAWLLARSPNVLLIPGTSSLVHLRENLAVADLAISRDRLLAKGTQAGELFGARHTGKIFDMMSIDILTVRDGTVAQTYHLENWLGALAQLSTQ